MLEEIDRRRAHSMIRASAALGPALKERDVKVSHAMVQLLVDQDITVTVSGHCDLCDGGSITLKCKCIGAFRACTIHSDRHFKQSQARVLLLAHSTPEASPGCSNRICRGSPSS
jgi:hypothetical protein